MKIIADNNYAHVEITLRVSSPKKQLVTDEIATLRSDLANGIINKLSTVPLAKFSVADGEIQVKK